MVTIATKDLEVEARSEDYLVLAGSRPTLPMVGLYLSGLLLEHEDLVNSFLNVMLSVVSISSDSIWNSPTFASSFASGMALSASLV
jgi:hypothetical protein